MLRCDVPGCTAMHVSERWMRTHRKECRATFEYDSPTCPSCGYQTNDRVVREDGTEVVKGKARSASGHWERHVTRFRRTRLVRCHRCGTPHLIPGCMATPRMMDRQFRCSDNFMKSEVEIQPRELECRRRLPREGGEPEWLGKWREEVDALTDDDVESETSSTDGHEGEVMGSTLTGVDTDPQNEGERRINMLRGPPEAGGQLIPYDSIEPNATEVPAATAVPIGRTTRRNGRRRTRRRRVGRRRQRRRPDRQRRRTTTAAVVQPT